MTTANPNVVTEIEEQKKDDMRFQELNKKPETERTPEETKELGELKERYGKRMQAKIDKMTFEKETAKEEAERERKERERLEKELKEEREKKVKSDLLSKKDDYIEISGKKWLTDEALVARIDAGEITEYEANRYAKQRDKEEILSEIDKRNDEKKNREEFDKVRSETAQDVLKNYPHFSKNHPDFNSSDPLYKLTNELYAEGYATNPKGLSLALKRAKEILRISDTRIDRSDDLSAEEREISDRREKTEKEIVLNDAEKEIAEKIYCRGDVLNPKTNQPYTVQEAYQKALEAKKSRLRKE